jgi:hypothetical protein
VTDLLSDTDQREQSYCDPLFSLPEKEHSVPGKKGKENYFAADVVSAISVGESIIAMVLHL